MDGMRRRKASLDRAWRDGGEISKFLERGLLAIQGQVETATTKAKAMTAAEGANE
jgi:hypothetical protein